MKLSVCLITLNEEKNIDRVLSCAQKFADEIIVVDTGSNDLTVVKSLKYTDKIYNFKWVYDFAKARNFAFSKASGDYLMWLDADDYISDENCKRILKIKNTFVPKDTYMFKYACGENDGKHELVFYRERIVRNCPLAKFQGFVHEVISPFGEIEYCDITVEHKKQSASNPRRNFNLYKMNQKTQKLSIRDEYYYAKEYYYLGYYRTAKKRLLKFINSGKGYTPDVRDAYITAYECSVFLGDKNPSKYLFGCIEKVGLDGELSCKIGDYFQSKEQVDEAIKFYLLALKFEPDRCVGFIKTEYYYLYPLLQLCSVYYKIGDRKSSYFYHKKCMEKYSDDKRVASNQEFFKSLNFC